MQYKVLRPLDGDRAYKPGDTMEANPVDVVHLLGTSLTPLDLETAVPVPLGTDAAGEGPVVEPDAIGRKGRK